MHTEDLKHWIGTELWDQVPVRISVINRGFEIVEANRSLVGAYGEWQGRPCYAVYKGRSERTAAVGETVGGLAHGIKNTFTGLGGGMYAIKSGIESGREERTAKGWEMLDRDVGWITALVKGFLSYSKKHVPKMEEIDPQEVAREVFSLYYAGALKDGMALRFERGSGSDLVAEKGK